MKQNRQDLLNHPKDGETSSGSVTREAQQVLSAQWDHINQTNCLLERIAATQNLKQAFKAVKRNKGAAGVDKISIEEFAKHLDFYIGLIQDQLLSHGYCPTVVRGVKIPKPKGGHRQLGIPTVKDRIVQQAISQVLVPIIDPTFSNHSYGFRPKRSARDAIWAAQQYVAEGRTWVVDVDLEKFFDTVNHDVIMGLIAKRVEDKALLKLIRKFLTAGMMENGICTSRKIGTPQGGPLSPLLANIMLHQLDVELEKRGHTFCRYADDFNIYVRSEAAAKRVLSSISAFIEDKLKLTVNRDKSAVDKIQNRQFLGFRLLNNATITISPEARKRIFQTIREVLKRNRGISLERMIREVNARIIGWFHYFKIAESKRLMQQLDARIRRKLRTFRLKQRKRKYGIKTFLTKQGVNRHDSWTLAKSDKGWWRKSLNPVAHKAMSKSWFGNMGLASLLHMFVQYRSETAVCDIARTVV